MSSNWDYIKAAIDEEIDDGGASAESVIYYYIACPYYGNDVKAHCNDTDEPDRKTCVACKAEWLEMEYE